MKINILKISMNMRKLLVKHQSKTQNLSNDLTLLLISKDTWIEAWRPQSLNEQSQPQQADERRFIKTTIFRNIPLFLKQESQ